MPRSRLRGFRLRASLTYSMKGEVSKCEGCPPETLPQWILVWEISVQSGRDGSTHPHHIFTRTKNPGGQGSRVEQRLGFNPLSAANPPDTMKRLLESNHLTSTLLVCGSGRASIASRALGASPQLLDHGKERAGSLMRSASSRSVTSGHV